MADFIAGDVACGKSLALLNKTFQQGVYTSCFLFSISPCPRYWAFVTRPHLVKHYPPLTHRYPKSHHSPYQNTSLTSPVKIQLAIPSSQNSRRNIHLVNPTQLNLPSSEPTSKHRTIFKENSRNAVQCLPDRRPLLLSLSPSSPSHLEFLPTYKYKPSSQPKKKKTLSHPYNGKRRSLVPEVGKFPRRSDIEANFIQD